MAKVVGDTTNLLKGGKPRPSGGHFYRRDKAGRLLVQSKPQPHKPSGPESAWISNFTCLAHFTKAPWSGDFNNAQELQDQSGWYWRDVIHAALSGKLLGDPLKRVTTPTARVKREAAETLSNGVEKYLTPDTLDWDNNVFWDPTANQSRLTVRSKGLYLVGANAEFNNITGGRRNLRLVVNRTTGIGQDTVGTSSAQFLHLSPVTIWPFNAGDYVEALAFATVAGVTARLDALWILAITPEGVI